MSFLYVSSIPGLSVSVKSFWLTFCVWLADSSLSTLLLRLDQAARSVFHKVLGSSVAHCLFVGQYHEFRFCRAFAHQNPPANSCA